VAGASVLVEVHVAQALRQPELVRGVDDVHELSVPVVELLLKGLLVEERAGWVQAGDSRRKHSELLEVDLVEDAALKHDRKAE
jgi:hypothetical protein